MMINVLKRDGEVAEFNLQKIGDAISKAFTATQKIFNEDIINLLALRVTSDFQSKVKDGTISVEDIQDSVEHILEQSGYTDVAKAYILYRKFNRLYFNTLFCKSFLKLNNLGFNSCFYSFILSSKLCGNNAFFGSDVYIDIS